jgi:hypothetical protein
MEKNKKSQKNRARSTRALRDTSQGVKKGVARLPRQNHVVAVD